MDGWFVNSRLNKVWIVSADSWIEIKHFTAYITFYSTDIYWNVYLGFKIQSMNQLSFTERLSWPYRPNRGFHSILIFCVQEYYVLRAFNVYVTFARAFRARECLFERIFRFLRISHPTSNNFIFRSFLSNFYFIFSSSLILCLILLENAWHQFNLRNRYL